jgi:hypothetical protein
VKKSILVLILITTILPEIFTGSTSLSAFFNPAHIIFLLVGYGFAAVVLREIAVRYNLSYGGLYALGFAFGIFNEGILAKTLIRITDLPISQYNEYGYLAGINLPFTLAISSWHALASFLIPILIVYWLYPEKAHVQWLGKTSTAIFSVILVIIGSSYFLSEYGGTGSPQQLIVLLGLMLVSFFIARRYKQKEAADAPSSKKSFAPLWLGISIFVPLHLILGTVASIKAPLFLYLVLFALVISGYIRILKKKNWLDLQHLMLFGIGNYIQIALLGFALSFMFPATMVERLIIGTLSIIALFWFSRKVAKS